METRTQYKARWNRERRANETPEQREQRLAIRRLKSGAKRQTGFNKSAWDRARRENYRTEIDARVRQWRLDNPERVRELRALHEARRRSRIRGTTVSDDPRINAMYEIAAWLRAQGDDVHVDHIRPLAAGGTHTIDNLQILPATENLRKGARYFGE